MSKCNQLFQDERERQIEQYLAEHPDADGAEAYEALFGDEDDR
jgi:hypothetical protein